MAERHEDVRFEPTDVRIGPVVGFLIVLVAALGIAMVLLWIGQAFEIGRVQTKDDSVVAKDQAFPPEPRIEGLGLDQASHSVTNIELSTSARSQRLREEQMLASGWTDAAGKKHPPIEQAMKRLIADVKKGGR